MLSREENELVTRVGQGTPMGNAMRMYWIPALLSREVADVVATVGLGPVLAKRVQALSKGYNRRLIVAIGLIAPHPVLLMDEPFDGFDLRQTREMTRVLRREAQPGSVERRGVGRDRHECPQGMATWPRPRMSALEARPSTPIVIIPSAMSGYCTRE